MSEITPPTGSAVSHVWGDIRRLMHTKLKAMTGVTVSFVFLNNPLKPLSSFRLSSLQLIPQAFYRI